MTSVKLTDLYVIIVKEAGQLKTTTHVNPKTLEREKAYYRQLQPVTNKLTSKQTARIDFEARKHFHERVAPQLRFS